MLGGKVSKGEVKLNSNGEEEMWKQGRYVEQFFVPEAVIGAVVMSLVGQQLDCFKEGTKEGSITVSQEKLMKRGELLLRHASIYEIKIFAYICVLIFFF